MASPSTPIMVGGAKLQDSVLEWSKKSLNLYSTVFLVLLVISILFADKLPMEARWQLSTTPGRLLLLLLLYITNLVCGWQAALLFSIAVALVWAARPVFKPVSVPDPVLNVSVEGFGQGSNLPGLGVEGFNDVKTTDTTKPKWFIEKTLHENPMEIIEDRINTSAVQDNSAVANGRTSR
jgi:hypothetical protein